MYIYLYLMCTSALLYFINQHKTNVNCQLIIFFLFWPTWIGEVWHWQLDFSSCPAITLHDLLSHVTETGLADGIRRALRFLSPPLLLAFSCDRAADDTDPLWHFTLCSLIAAADSGIAHHTAAYFLFFPLFGFFFSLFFFPSELTREEWCTGLFESCLKICNLGLLCLPHKRLQKNFIRFQICVFLKL